MRRQLILFGSVGLNILLLAAWLAARQRSEKLRAHPPQPPTPSVSNVYRTHIVVRKQFFTWQELESPDYKAYVVNLRQIGCPEQTIRDIIVADVNQLYARKRAAEVPTADQEWWRYEPDAAFTQAVNEKLAALEQERQNLLTTLLGPNWNAPDPGNATGISLNGSVLGQLSADTKRAVMDAVTRSQQRTQDYLDAQKAAGKPADSAVLAKLGQQLRVDLAQVLSTAQLEEFLLRYSESAASLRQRLRGVNVTPDEFRAIFRAVDPLEQSMALAEGDAQSKARLNGNALNQIDQALKNVLGPDRYQAYRTTQEPAYQEAYSTADEYGGATDKQILALYDLNRAAQQEQQRINNDDNLQPEQKAAQLAQIEKQQQQASDLILGQTPDVSPSDAGSARIYSYQPAENLDMIAAKFGVSKNAILTANPALNFNALTPGMPIRIPAPPAQ